MFSNINKLWRYLSFVLRAKKVWVWPRQSKVLIYDAANREILLEYLKPWNPEILHVRNEQINIRALLKSLFRKGRRVDAYIDCFVEKVNPRLLVTIVDNNATFYTISERHPNVKTIFLQNGLRGYYQDVFEYLDNLNFDAKKTFFVDHMFVFGSAIAERYSKYIRGSILPIGSIKNNFMTKEKSPETGTIAFISSWRNSKGWFLKDTFFSFEEVWEIPDNLILQCLMKYAKEKNKRVVIIPNQPKNSELFIQEKNYFRKLMNGEPEFLLPTGTYPSYSATDSTEIVVAFDSTLGYESIARGNKTAVLAFRGTMQGVISSWDFGWPLELSKEGLFWTNKPDPKEFVRILDYLFEVTDEQWQKDVESTNFSSIMEYAPDNTILQSILDKELGPPPPSAH
jgi:surface carbohydrate biosynthesis protein